MLKKRLLLQTSHVDIARSVAHDNILFDQIESNQRNDMLSEKSKRKKHTTFPALE